MPANTSITFDVEQGEVFALLGPNGAGKTTLVRQLVGLLRPESGSIHLLDKSLDHSPDYTARHVSYMPQSGEAFNHLQAGEILYFAAHLRGYSRHDAQRERDRLIELLDLGDIHHNTAMSLSGGQRRLVMVATTLAASLPVMILDEPTNDLDPQKRRFVWDLLRRQRADFGTTILLVTHNIIEAEPIIDRLAIMMDGRLLKVGRLGDLKAPLREHLKLEVRFAAAAPQQLPVDGHVLMRENGRLEMLIPPTQASRIIDVLTCQPHIEDFVLRPPTLEDLYLNTLNEE